jgi:transposase
MQIRVVLGRHIDVFPPFNISRGRGAQGAIPGIPNRANRKKKFRRKKTIYRERNHVERFFNKLKPFRRIATRHGKLRRHLLRFHQARSRTNLAAIN